MKPNLKIYNTASRQVEEFSPIDAVGGVKIYSCGPTVYASPHIGNMRAYIFADTLKRTLRFLGFNVTHVLNITDVGHLTSDADSGDDKVELAAKKLSKDAYEITRYYTDEFLRSLNLLNIGLPDIMPKATEHIQEQINLIKVLESKDYTYVIPDGVYFDTSKYSDYGKFSGIDASKLKGGARVDMGDKKSVTDFALWKLSNTEQDRQMEWESPWGKGFPGWHIECSAMSMRYLGESFDIHTGGIDHVPVHHQNEIAQSECATGKTYSKYWMHSGFLQVDNQKMSKSLGNIYTIEYLVSKGFHPLSFKMFVIMSRHRSTLNFTFDALQSADNSLNKLYSIIADLKRQSGYNNDVDLVSFTNYDHYCKEIKKIISDDLDTPRLLATMWSIIKDSSVGTEDKLLFCLLADQVLGLGLDRVIENYVTIPENIVELARKRDLCRSEKKWVEADFLRNQIENEGYVLEDNQSKTIVRLKK